MMKISFMRSGSNIRIFIVRIFQKRIIEVFELVGRPFLFDLS